MNNLLLPLIYKIGAINKMEIDAVDVEALKRGRFIGRTFTQKYVLAYELIQLQSIIKKVKEVPYTLEIHI